jgi:hypothetical protein
VGRAASNGFIQPSGGRHGRTPSEILPTALSNGRESNFRRIVLADSGGWKEKFWFSPELWMRDPKNGCDDLVTLGE